MIKSLIETFNQVDSFIYHVILNSDFGTECLKNVFQIMSPSKKSTTLQINTMLHSDPYNAYHVT